MLTYGAVSKDLPPCHMQCCILRPVIAASRAGHGHLTWPHVQVVSALVGEIVLCVKEVNQKTRAAAFELLVSLARAMHEADPPSVAPPDGDAAMGAQPPSPPPPLPSGACRSVHSSVCGLRAADACVMASLVRHGTQQDD